MPFMGADINKVISIRPWQEKESWEIASMCKMMKKEEKRQKGVLFPETAGLTVASQLTMFHYSGQVSKFKIIQERLARDKKWDDFSPVAPI